MHLDFEFAGLQVGWVTRGIREFWVRYGSWKVGLKIGGLRRGFPLFLLVRVRFLRGMQISDLRFFRCGWVWRVDIRAGGSP